MDSFVPVGRLTIGKYLQKAFLNSDISPNLTGFRCYIVHYGPASNE